mmetsp:Transcript_94681/g.267723  ORF Transcript_94681/g.267723 Transcript_94681/m.267723 type:complete len:308 (-) Transcript_94681:65-988(-)
MHLSSMRASLCILFLTDELGRATCLRSTGYAPIGDMGQCPENGITSYGHFDGFGATYAAMISIFMYAKWHNVTYCTTRWDHICHDVRMDEMFDWVGGSKLGPPADSHRTNQLYGCPNVWWSGFKFTGSEEAAQNVRDAYFQTLKEDASLNLFAATASSTSENVAWHIRRGDVGQLSGSRYTSNDKIGQGLKTLLETRSVNVVHFFSEGLKTDFQHIIDVCMDLAIECMWHLDVSVLATHYSLSIADVLILTHSTFSWSAAFLNNGTVLKEAALFQTGVPGKVKLQPMDLQAKLEYLGLISDSARNSD